MQTIGARLQSFAMNRRGWNGLQLAKELGVSYETLRKWTTGETAPNRNRVKTICAVLEVSPDWVLLGAAEPAKPDFVARTSEGVYATVEVKPTGPEALSPPPPPEGFADRLEVSLSDWALLQDVKNAATPDEIATIQARARRLDAHFESLVERRLQAAREAMEFKVHSPDAYRPVGVSLGGTSNFGEFHDAPAPPAVKKKDRP